jgi:D-alanyl-lipoteichoic acid acyltransferase DltB (MBOAT superfamily)
MIFTSLNFFIFFSILIIVYFITPVRYKWAILLFFSYFYYFNTKPIFVLITIWITVTTYIFTSLITRAENESVKGVFLKLNIFLIILPLFFFKYYNSINTELFSFLKTFHVQWTLPQFKYFLPIGISYYTFMAVGYTVDVYNEDIQNEKNLCILALFISFFPLILSGPIERAKNMIPQFKSLRNPDYITFTSGLKLILWGIFMKLVVADRIGIYVDAIYNNIYHHNGITLLIASLLYPFQVYADLGGYSLISIGVSKTLGIHVMENFRRPFLSLSVSEFWRRWHISLISWLTDYIYTPLSFTLRKYKDFGIVFALMVTFFVSGIWHGAKLNYIAWGLFQGLLLSIEVFTNRKRRSFENKFNLKKKVWYVIPGICLTYSLFSISQIIARSSCLSDSKLIFTKIVTLKGPIFLGSPSTIIYSLMGISFLLVKDFFDEYTQNKLALFENKNKLVRTLSYSSIIIIILLFGVFDGGQFIYFQF